jgi:hypothetical protein
LLLTSEYLDACKITIITADNLEIIPEKYNAAPSEEVAEAF